MYRVDHPTGVAILPAPTPPTATPDRFYYGGNEATGQAATRVEDQHLNMIQEEICNAVLGAGLALRKDQRNQLFQAIYGIAYGAVPAVKLLLTGPTNFFIDANSGSDTMGTGEETRPWRTINHALQYLATYIELAGHSAFINLAPGTYTSVYWAGSALNNGTVYVQGDSVNPRSRIIRGNNAAAIQCTTGAWLWFDGVSVEAVGAGPGWMQHSAGIRSLLAARIVYRNFAFGPCHEGHMDAYIGGSIWTGGATNYTIYDGAPVHISSAVGSVVTNAQSSVTVQNNPAFSAAFANCAYGGFVEAMGTIYTGSAQGVRASVIYNGIIITGSPTPLLHFPGNQPAQVSNGGFLL